jgi:hypothetical protein
MNLEDFGIFITVICTISTMISFTLIGTISLMQMHHPEYKVYWYEKNDFIRSLEIGFGIYSLFFMSIFIIYVREQYNALF